LVKENTLLLTNKKFESCDDEILVKELVAKKPRELSKEEELLVTALKEKDCIAIDDLCLICQLPMSKVSGILLTLEFSGVVKSLPGKMYCLN
jgi:predicted Rossmann fold nucleotide-binding protein DprA/Smf involved in DNA uptake